MPVVTATIASLHLYPVKSLRAMNPASAVVRQLGLAGDRRWLVVDPEGRFLTQRKVPAMARIGAELVEEGLLLSYGTLSSTLAPRIDYPALHDVRVWNRVVLAVDQGDEVATWLTMVLGQMVRLVAIPPGLEEAPGSHQTAFADGFPLLVVNEASVDFLNKELAAKGLPPVGPDRFRANLVLRGLEPWAEDDIAELRIGSVRLRFDKACARCRVVSTDQETGIHNTEPLATLAEFRTGMGGRGITFGWNATITAGVGHSLNVGDEVEVIRRDPTETLPV